MNTHEPFLRLLNKMIVEFVSFHVKINFVILFRLKKLNKK